MLAKTLHHSTFQLLRAAQSNHNQYITHTTIPQQPWENQNGPFTQAMATVSDQYCVDFGSADGGQNRTL